MPKPSEPIRPVIQELNVRGGMTEDSHLCWGVDPGLQGPATWVLNVDPSPADEFNAPTNLRYTPQTGDFESRPFGELKLKPRRFPKGWFFDWLSWHVGVIPSPQGPVFFLNGNRVLLTDPRCRVSDTPKSRWSSFSLTWESTPLLKLRYALEHEGPESLREFAEAIGRFFDRIKTTAVRHPEEFTISLPKEAKAALLARPAGPHPSLSSWLDQNRALAENLWTLARRFDRKGAGKDPTAFVATWGGQVIPTLTGPAMEKALLAVFQDGAGLPQHRRRTIREIVNRWLVTVDWFDQELGEMTGTFRDVRKALEDDRVQALRWLNLSESLVRFDCRNEMATIASFGRTGKDLERILELVVEALRRDCYGGATYFGYLTQLEKLVRTHGLSENPLGLLGRYNRLNHSEMPSFEAWLDDLADSLSALPTKLTGRVKKGAGMGRFGAILREFPDLIRTEADRRRVGTCLNALYKISFGQGDRHHQYHFQLPTIFKNAAHLVRSLDDFERLAREAPRILESIPFEIEKNMLGSEWVWDFALLQRRGKTAADLDEFLSGW